MLPIDTILVPVVFSRRCAWAARYAACLAKEFRSELLFLNVGQKKNVDSLEDFVLQEVGAVPHKSHVAAGDPADRIIEFARESHSDLIVMPTYHVRHRTFLIGSVTAKVLHDVPTPILTGVHRYNDTPQIPDAFHNIVCAIDDTPECVDLWRWANELADTLGAGLRFVHAIPAVDETSENCGEVDVRRYLTKQANEHFAEYFAAAPKVPAIHIRGGEVARVVRDAALTDHADLVIVGRGHADRTLGLLRTQTYSIVRNSPCPVISV